MARYRIVLDFEGPTVPLPPLATLPQRYYGQLVLQALAMGPVGLDPSLTGAIVAATYPGTRLLAATLAKPES